VKDRIAREDVRWRPTFVVGDLKTSNRAAAGQADRSSREVFARIFFGAAVC
jgi:hypothetical protein